MDTAEHVQQQLVHFYRQMFAAAGLQVDEAARVEVDPRFALTPAALKERIPAGSIVKEDTYFH